MQNLAQNSLLKVILGPFLDSDGVPVTTLTAAALDSLDLFKPGSATAIDIKTLEMAHRSNGVYTITLGNSYTDVVGIMSIYASKDDTFIQVYAQLNVMIESEYNYRYASIETGFESDDFGSRHLNDGNFISYPAGDYEDPHGDGDVWVVYDMTYTTKLRPRGISSEFTDRGYAAYKITYSGNAYVFIIKKADGSYDEFYDTEVFVPYEIIVGYDCIFYDDKGPYISVTASTPTNPEVENSDNTTVDYIYAEVAHEELPGEHESALLEINNRLEPSAVASAVWNAGLEYKDTDGTTKTNKAWLMMQSLFSVFKQKMKELI